MSINGMVGWRAMHAELLQDPTRGRVAVLGAGSAGTTRTSILWKMPEQMLASIQKPSCAGLL